MSTNLKELGELIQIASKAGVHELSIDGSKFVVKFITNTPESHPHVPKEYQGPIEVSPELAERIAEIQRQEEELNKMIENPEEYEEELARLEEHELEDIPGNTEGES